MFAHARASNTVESRWGHSNNVDGIQYGSIETDAIYRGQQCNGSRTAHTVKCHRRRSNVVRSVCMHVNIGMV